MKPQRGALILTFGILGIICCFAFGIAAWVMGNSDLKEMDAGQRDPSGRDLTKTGKLLGIIGLALQGLGVIFYAVALALGMMARAF